jgi:predicted metal-dependent HD superfamily phosphohydrolase
MVTLEPAARNPCLIGELVELVIRHVTHQMTPLLAIKPPAGVIDQDCHGRKPGRLHPVNAHDPETEPSELEIAWREHIHSDTELLNRLIKRYRERQRRYHKVGHIESMIRHVNTLVAVEPAEDLGVVIAAALYHDAIYEPTHPANERASARLARRDLIALGWPAPRVDLVATMIEGTKTHDAPPDVGTAALFDADLAILGAEPEAYGKYVAATRAEYSHVDDADWLLGRTAVLQSFLDRQQIFASATARDLWETTARTNIAAELAQLHP